MYQGRAWYQRGGYVTAEITKLSTIYLFYPLSNDVHYNKTEEHLPRQLTKRPLASHRAYVILPREGNLDIKRKRRSGNDYLRENKPRWKEDILQDS